MCFINKLCLTNSKKIVIIISKVLCNLADCDSFLRGGGKLLKIKKICSLAVSGILACLTAFTSLTASAEFLADNDKSLCSSDHYFIEPTDTEILSYSDYYDKYVSEKRPDTEILIGGAEYMLAENGDFSTGSCGAEVDIRDNVLIWESCGGSLAYEINVPETGIYCLGIGYFPLDSNSADIELSMKIDGQTPYDTASRITLNRVWVNENDIYTDIHGNQIRPSQIQKGMWQETVIGDVDGLFSEPLFFYLEKGTHEIRFSSERAEFAIEYLKFFNQKEIPSYSEYKNSANASVSIENTASKLIRIEGESAKYKSDPTLCPTSDNSSYLTSPSDPVKVVYNTFGGGNWKKALQTVSWTVTAEEVGEGGWFRLGIKSRQNQMRGFCSNRRIYIDGEVPCKELEQVRFFYDNDWNVVTPQTSDGEDIYIFLEGGTEHTITMECVPGEIGSSLRRLDDVITELNTYYRKILMITGPSPDKHTDYYVHEKIPELVDEFDRISNELTAIQSEIESLSGAAGSEAAILETTAVTLDKCVKKPLKIPSYLSQIKDNIAAVSAWMHDYRDQPLELDYIELSSADMNFSDCRESLIKSAEFGLKSFFGSFFEDYTTLSDVTGAETIEVWVSLGRDQAQVIKEMTENDFMQETGIPISVNLVTGGIVEASLAGKGPDVALFLGGEFPINLAARDMLVDMSEFSDFDETAMRFQKNAMTHYEYNGGTYGLPISQTFPMTFYRTDILAELGFTSPPETWNDLIDMLPALQRNYMSVGLVLPTANISPATESGHTFAMLLLQKGMNYYNDELSATTFDSIEAVQSFEEWTDFYTKYSFEQTYDPFSRFRTGEYPIVIAEHTFYNQLAAASPEIKGLWSFCPVPGTERADGTVSHAANSTGTGAVIFKKVKNKKNAWEFVKWFTETETQAGYAAQIEGLLGTMGRFETANVEALSRLSWSDSELERLYAQQEELVEIPILPSSYAITRNIMNAFRETVNGFQNPRDTLIWYNRDINDEIARKHEDLGINEEG